MSDITTVTGIVASVPKHLVTTSGLAITSFRLASGQRKFDRAKNAWVDLDTNWYSVSTFRHLAYNVVRSVNKGDHIVVTGRLRVRDWANEERRGTSVDLEADSVGHDLFWCTTSATRSAPSSAAVAEATAQAAIPEQAEGEANQSAWFDGRPPATEPGDGFLPPASGGEARLVTVDS